MRIKTKRVSTKQKTLKFKKIKENCKLSKSIWMALQIYQVPKIPSEHTIQEF